MPPECRTKQHLPAPRRKSRAAAVSVTPLQSQPRTGTPPAQGLGVLALSPRFVALGGELVGLSEKIAAPAKVTQMAGVMGAVAV